MKKFLSILLAVAFLIGANPFLMQSKAVVTSTPRSTTSKTNTLKTSTSKKTTPSKTNTSKAKEYLEANARISNPPIPQKSSSGKTVTGRSSSFCKHDNGYKIEYADKYTHFLLCGDCCKLLYRSPHNDNCCYTSRMNRFNDIPDPYATLYYVDHNERVKSYNNSSSKTIVSSKGGSTANASFINNSTTTSNTTTSNINSSLNNNATAHNNSLQIINRYYTKK